jgi:predicted regulator of Ras-like GTPase activity (Roadblock/LC7/MglB family)
MQQILENLNRSVGVVGSAVMTHDGMLVTSALSDRQDEETLAAIGSSLVTSTQHSLKELDATLKLMTVDGSRGKIVLVSAGEAYLLVITDNTIALDATMLDIKSAVQRLRRRISLDN